MMTPVTAAKLVTWKEVKNVHNCLCKHLGLRRKMEGGRRNTDRI